MDKRPVNFSQKGFSRNFLSFMKMLEKNDLCCLDFLTQVTTENTASVTFSGLGTPSNPLRAIASGGSGSPAGTNNDIQFNEGGAFAADSGNFTYDPTFKAFATPNLSQDPDVLSYIDTSGNSFNISGGGISFTTSTSKIITFADTGFSVTTDNDTFNTGGGSGLLNYSTATDNLSIGGNTFNYSSQTDVLLVENGFQYSGAASGIFTITGAGKVGINLNPATAQLEISASDGTAGTAPIKLNSGALLSSTVNGVFEFDGTHLYFTIGAIRHTII
jgi:hypothetical protein